MHVRFTTYADGIPSIHHTHLSPLDVSCSKLRVWFTCAARRDGDEEHEDDVLCAERDELCGDSGLGALRARARGWLPHLAQRCRLRAGLRAAVSLRPLPFALFHFLIILFFKQSTCRRPRRCVTCHTLLLHTPTPLTNPLSPSAWRTDIHTHMHTHTHQNIHIYIYILSL